MKKVWWVVIACAVIVLGAAAFAFKRAPTGDSLPSVRPFIVSERTIYYDPSEFLKSMPASMVSSIPKSMLRPTMVRISRTKKMTYAQINDLMHHDLTAKNQWTFTPWPPTGVSPTTLKYLPKMIVASQGSSSGPSVGVLFATPSTSNHSINAMALRMDLTTEAKAAANQDEAETYIITEQKRLSEMEVALLKIQHLGKSPFASQEEVTKAMMETMGLPEPAAPSVSSTHVSMPPSRLSKSRP